MEQVIRILHLEDDAVDAELVQARLESAGLSCRVTLVQTRDEYAGALKKGGYDIILGDYQLPAFDGMSALRLSREVCPDVPFIFVSGAMGEDAAIEGSPRGRPTTSSRRSCRACPPRLPVPSRTPRTGGSGRPPRKR
jgi:CheY-like chemotaxis protein